MKITPVLLVILDGFGHREDCDDNAICQARKPKYPQCLIIDLCEFKEKTC